MTSGPGPAFQSVAPNSSWSRPSTFSTLRSCAGRTDRLGSLPAPAVPAVPLLSTLRTDSGPASCREVARRWVLHGTSGGHSPPGSVTTVRVKDTVEVRLSRASCFTYDDATAIVAV